MCFHVFLCVFCPKTQILAGRVSVYKLYPVRRTGSGSFISGAHRIWQFLLRCRFTGYENAISGAAHRIKSICPYPVNSTWRVRADEVEKKRLYRALYLFFSRARYFIGVGKPIKEVDGHASARRWVNSTQIPTPVSGLD